MFDIFVWLVTGLVTGWVAALLFESGSFRYPYRAIVSGGIGGLLGGIISAHYLTSVPGFDITRVAYALLGAIVVTSIVEFISSKS